MIWNKKVSFSSCYKWDAACRVCPSACSTQVQNCRGCHFAEFLLESKNSHQLIFLQCLIGQQVCAIFKLMIIEKTLCTCGALKIILKVYGESIFINWISRYIFSVWLRKKSTGFPTFAVPSATFCIPNEFSTNFLFPHMWHICLIIMFFQQRQQHQIVLLFVFRKFLCQNI